MSTDPRDPRPEPAGERQQLLHQPGATSGYQAPTRGTGATELHLTQLCRTCDTAGFDFETTDELAPVEQAFGQERAVEALHFALSMDHDGYNAFVMGPPGSGRRYLLRRVLEEVARTQPTPPDLAYVRDFSDARRPKALTLEAGEGPRLDADMEAFVADLRVSLPTAFTSEQYASARMALERGLQQRHTEALEPARELAAERGLLLQSTGEGFMLAPMEDGQVLSPEARKQLPPERLEELEASAVEVRQKVMEVMREAPAWSREKRRLTEQLDQETATEAVAPMIARLQETWAHQEEVVAWLAQVGEDVAGHVEQIRADPDESELPPQLRGPEQGSPVEAFLQRYRVNVLVSHEAGTGAPVVWEEEPSLAALAGRIEHRSRMGALVTDFSLVRPGALHRANGGFLVLDARQVLTSPRSWQHLEASLRNRHAVIRSQASAMSVMSTVTLEPEPLPLDLKVVLVGERSVYFKLSALDPEFAGLFKVAVDFEDTVPRDPANLQRLAGLVGTLVRQDDLLHVTAEGVARVATESSRAAGDSRKLSANVGLLTSLLKEADRHARGGPFSEDTVPSAMDAVHISAAIAARRRRTARIHDRILEGIVHGTVNIATEGAEVGEANALVVVSMAKEAFGHPSRVTAQVHVGPGKVLDIEREVQLSGPLHSKGVLILQGFLGARYAAERPLPLQASLVFEQSYGPVDGDSATLAETCALMSALAEAPLRQDIALTGSMDQRGRVQAIGGVNQKIEGFFDVCKARGSGLTGTQGVIVPTDNVPNLMLRQDILDAAAAGLFHVWSVDTVDDAMTLLSGLPCGERTETGAWVAEGIDARIHARLESLDTAQAERARRLGAAAVSGGLPGGEPPIST